MHYFLLFFAILLSLTLSSCRASLSLSVNKPAEIQLPKEVGKIVVVNDVSNWPSSDKIIGTMLGTQQIDGPRIASKRAIDGVVRTINDSENYHIEMMDDSILSNRSNTWEYIDSIGIQKNIDAYIILNELNAESPLGGTVLANWRGLNYDVLNGSMCADIHIVESSTTIHRVKVSQKFEVPISGSINPVDMLDDLLRKRKYYREMGFQLGTSLAQLLEPQKVIVERSYFKKGTKEIKKASGMIAIGNWDVAEKQLLQKLESRNSKNKSRLYFNLALVKECQGDIVNAIAYAEASLLEKSTDKANSYLKVLVDRKEVFEKAL